MRRRPVPPEVHAVRGFPGKQAKTARERGLPAPQGVPAMPRGLRPNARECWRRLVAQLDEIGGISLLDRAVLAAYCQTFAAWKLACECHAEPRAADDPPPPDVADRLERAQRGLSTRLRRLRAELRAVP